MMQSIAGDIVNFFLNHSFCCVVVFAPGLLLPIYRWLKSRLKRKSE